MGNQINLGVSAEGKSLPGSFRVPLTLNKVIDYIKMQELDDYTTTGLIELASRYPTNALPMFRKNFNQMIARVRAQRRKEQQGEEDGEEENNFQKFKHVQEEEITGEGPQQRVVEVREDAEPSGVLEV